MEYAILILLVIAICLLIAILVFLMTRKQNETDMTERLGRFELNINQEIQKFKDEVVSVGKAQSRTVRGIRYTVRRERAHHR